MSERTLRSSLIRLAHGNPELRERLLPLLKVAESSQRRLNEKELDDLAGEMKKLGWKASAHPKGHLVLPEMGDWKFSTPSVRIRDDKMNYVWNQRSYAPNAKTMAKAMDSYLKDFLKDPK